MSAWRRTLLRALAWGGLAWGLPVAWGAGMRPQPPGVRRLRGDVRINGAPAHEGRVLLPGDVVTTGPDSEVVYVLGTDAYLVRENSEVSHFAEGAQAVMRVITGKILSVFGPGPRHLQTATAVVGVRGTACYIESQPDLVYFCLCYGVVDLTPLADPAQAVVVQTTYHDRPYYIGREPAAGGLLRLAPVVNHSDSELIMLEAMTGRRPPFLNEGFTPRY